jgi:hypothetical protein
LSDEAAGCYQAIGVLDDCSDLVPVDLIQIGLVQVHAQRVCERSSRGHWRLEESLGIGFDQFLLSTVPDGTPQRDPTVAAVIVMEVTQGSLIPNEVAAGAVAHPLVDLWQRKRDLPHEIEFTLTHSGRKPSTARMCQSAERRSASASCPLALWAKNARSG